MSLSNTFRGVAIGTHFGLMAVSIVQVMHGNPLFLFSIGLNAGFAAYHLSKLFSTSPSTKPYSPRY